MPDNPPPRPDATQIDPVDLTARLIRCRSVTPEEGGALTLLDDILSAAGFACTRVDRNGVANLFARWGPRGHPRTFGFNGHTDVVPVGDAAAWSCDPFGAETREGYLMGRGATDMKSGVAAFVTAAIRMAAETPDGALIVTVTGDEEGPSTDGTLAILDWMKAQDEAMTACIVGEPGCVERFGDTVKIGRRGSATFHLKATGVQGHAAYPHRARNPVPALARLVDRLSSQPLDAGTAHFDPSTLAAVTFDTGNPAQNVIPASARAIVNVRFNDRWTGEALLARLQEAADAVTAETGIGFDLQMDVSGDCFLTPPGALSALVAEAVKAETGLLPALSTSGGTSDARFIKDHCPVVEFGLLGRTMHEVDERVEAAQIPALASVYTRILRSYFA